MSDDEIFNKLNQSLDKRLNRFKKDTMKEIKSHFEKLIKQFQAKVTELEVSNIKLKNDANHFHQGLNEIKSQSSTTKGKTSAYFGLKQEDFDN